MTAFVYLLANAGIDITPIVVGVVAAIGGAFGATLLTYRSTNVRLRAEGQKLSQDAITAVEQRGQTYVTTMDKIRQVLEERLAKTERDLAEAKRALEIMEERWRDADRALAISQVERGKVVAEADAERERLRQRIAALEAQVEDLRREIPGKRHADPPEDG